LGENPNLYPVENAARYACVSTSFLNKARLTGDGPEFLKLGRKIVYEKSALDAWLASRRRRSTSQKEAA
jgi:hypothetical protein